MNKMGLGNRIIFYIMLIILAGIMFFPFYWMIISSLKTMGAVSEIPPDFFPNPINWGNYVEILIENHFIRYFFNSVFVAIFDIGGMLLSCSLVAYGLSMFQFKGKNLIFIFMLATMMLPGQVTLIPHYLIFKELG